MSSARQVIVNQPSQNNTIILVDSSYRDSKNIWQSLEQSGVLGPIKNKRRVMDEYVNISSGGDQYFSRNKQQTYRTHVNSTRKREPSLRNNN